VLETLGNPLNTFKSTQQLCEVIRDAVIGKCCFVLSSHSLRVRTAHSATYNHARILHHDISAGNIMINKDSSGLLIDWDLSKKVLDELMSRLSQGNTLVQYDIFSLRLCTVN
jgi:serine/threonine protein kinase